MMQNGYEMVNDLVDQSDEAIVLMINQSHVSLLYPNHCIIKHNYTRANTVH